eukprot:TCONS_00041211-protein
MYKIINFLSKLIYLRIITSIMKCKADGTECRSSAEVFRNHFQTLYNQPPVFNSNILDSLDQCPIDDSLGFVPSTDEVNAINHLKNNAPGETGVTAQMLKSIAQDSVRFDYLYQIIIVIWANEAQLDTGRLVTLLEKGNLSKPGNYRGIMLL